MKMVVVDLTDPNLDHGIYVQVLKLRRDVFISNMGWNLYQHMGCEFDEYDTPASVHTVAMDGHQVVGCMRMMRTDTKLGKATYMIMDAHRGLIPNLPSGIMEHEICSEKAWEASRMAISADVRPTERISVLIGLLRSGVDYVKGKGGNSIIGLMNPVFERVFSRAGIDVERFGPVADQRDGRICVLKMSFDSV